MQKLFCGSHLAGFDAVVHLADLSNDPVGHLNPKLTFDINHRGTMHIAALAKKAGFARVRPETEARGCLALLSGRRHHA